MLIVLLHHPFPLILPPTVLCVSCAGMARALPKQREQVSILGDSTVDVSDYHPRRLCTCRCCPSISICRQHREAGLLSCLVDVIENISSYRIFKLLGRVFQVQEVSGTGIWPHNTSCPDSCPFIQGGGEGENATSQLWCRSPR